jgi:hypothetical protein
VGEIGSMRADSMLLIGERDLGAPTAAEQPRLKIGSRPP